MSWRKGKENWIVQNKADVAARKTELENLRVHRENRDNTRDMIIEIAEKAKPYFKKTEFDLSDTNKYFKVIDNARSRVNTLSEIPNECRMFYKDINPTNENKKIINIITINFDCIINLFNFYNMIKNHSKIWIINR